MKRFVFAFFAAASVSSVAATASAQAWLSDRSSTQGPGIRSGDLELHPGVAAEVGYDSNYFSRSPNQTGLPRVDTVRLRVTPSFHVSTLTTQRKDGAPAAPPKVSFDAGAALIYSQFLTNASSDGSDQSKLGRSNEFGVQGDLALLINPGRPWGFNIFDTYVRTTQPSLIADKSYGLDRDDNRAAGEIVYTKPGGLLDWRFGYAFGLTYFEQGNVQSLNNTRHEIYTKGRWKFLPRTAFVYDGSVQIIRYTNQTNLQGSTPLRTRFGLSGLLTDRLSLLAMIGWGASFYKNDKDFDSVIGQLELRYFLNGAAPDAGATAPPSMSSIAFGFTRDFYNSYLSNYYERDRGYVQVSALIAQRFYLGLDAGVALVKYGGVQAAGTPETISGARIDASLFGEYRVSDWLGFNATVQYVGDTTNTTFGVGPTALHLDFSRFQGLVGVRAFW